MDVSMDVSMTDNSQESTQPLSQSRPSTQVNHEEDLDAQSWGLLLPCTPGIERQRFRKTNREIKIGRDADNHVCLPWKCLSSFHAVIEWNGELGSQSVVKITDKSSNGTYLNREKIGRGSSRILTQGDEISFGPPRQHGERELSRPEYRYTFRDLVSQRRDVHKKYDFATELGQGTYARVYKALEKGTSKWVAVKVIAQTMRFNMSAAGEAAAIREISIMRSLRHPNICEFIDYYENPDKSIDIVLEYMDGGHLDSFIRRTNGGQGLGDPMSCHVVYQLCKGVAFIHKQNITHRDLKPENILLTPDNPPTVKIADFGLAKLVDDATALRTIVGTKVFMAPEIVTRQSTDSPYTNLVDSWSMGVILFLMFTGDTPFPSNYPPLQIKDLILNQLINWEHLDNRTDISMNGQDFVRQLLVFEPEGRMAISAVDAHPWLAEYRPTYDVQYPDELASGVQSVTRTPSLNSVAGVDTYPERSNRAPLARAVTEDPYADFPPMPPPAPPPNACRMRTPVERNTGTGLRNAGSWAAPALAQPRGHVAQGSTPQRPRPQPVAAYMPDSEDERLYGPTTVTAAGPSHAGAAGGAPKRTFAEMHTDGSSPLSSLASTPAPSPSPPPMKKKGKGKAKGAVKAKPKPKPKPAAGPSRPRKVQKTAAPDALRRSSRLGKKAYVSYHLVCLLVLYRCIHILTDYVCL
ncbi:kinase-like domain-containing protein [Mycena filopes]|nr:kinase-like domain-containing protein [Mycena filopes]